MAVKRRGEICDGGPGVGLGRAAKPVRVRKRADVLHEQEAEP